MTNKFSVHGDIAYIELDYKGSTLITRIERCDLEKVSSFPWTWHAQFSKDSGYFYAVGIFEGDSVLMHRLIMDAPKGVEVNHLNFDGLDNRRKFLRLATRSENASYRKGPNKNNKTGIRGVYWHESKQRFQVFGYVNGKRKMIGAFKTKEEATQNRIQYFSSLESQSEAKVL